MSPWQVFSLIFIIFYLTMKHLNNILASVVLTIIYGALMEITAKYLYVWNHSNTTGKTDQQYSQVVNDEDTDEELEEKYANIDVNFDESETEEEEDYVPRSSGQYDNKVSVLVKEEELEPVTPSYTEYEDVPVSRGKSFIQDDFLEDIDLEDPAVKAAATKIQSVFKGFKARRKVLSQTGYKCG